jgi:hypothetical protein
MPTPETLAAITSIGMSDPITCLPADTQREINLRMRLESERDAKELLDLILARRAPSKQEAAPLNLRSVESCVAALSDASPPAQDCGHAETPFPETASQVPAAATPPLSTHARKWLLQNFDTMMKRSTEQMKRKSLIRAEYPPCPREVPSSILEPRSQNGKDR